MATGPHPQGRIRNVVAWHSAMGPARTLTPPADAGKDAAALPRAAAAHPSFPPGAQ